MTQESKGPLLEPGHVPKSEAEDPDKPKEKSEAAQVAGRHKNSSLQAQCGEEVTFDVDVPPEIRFGEAQSVESQHHGGDRTRIADDKREWRGNVQWRGAAQSQGIPVPELHGQMTLEGHEQALQERCRSQKAVARKVLDCDSGVRGRVVR